MLRNHATKHMYVQAIHNGPQDFPLQFDLIPGDENDEGESAKTVENILVDRARALESCKLYVWQPDIDVDCFVSGLLNMARVLSI